VRQTSKPIAVLVSDLHLRHTAPVSRAEKGDAWYAVLGGYCDQLKRIAGDLPIVCAGDVFHKWNSPPELINWAIKHLPKMYAIPGQHDLPLHNMQDIHKSAYWTLVEAEVIDHLGSGSYRRAGKDLVVHGFPWGADVPKKVNTDWWREDEVHLAVVHAYCWDDGHSFPGAEPKNHVQEWYRRLKTYDAAVFGDNHKGFHQTFGMHNGSKDSFFEVINCGGFYRAKSDEVMYQPQVGVLDSDGSIRRKFLDVSKDEWEEDVLKAAQTPAVSVEELMELLDEAGDAAYDFAEAVVRRMERLKVSESVRKIVLKALEG
jgi:hypothetical protein